MRSLPAKSHFPSVRGEAGLNDVLGRNPFLSTEGLRGAEQAGNGVQNLPIGRDSGGVERKGHDGIPRNC